VAQGILAYRFRVFGYFDLPLIYCVYYGFTLNRPMASVFIGSILGLMQDSLSGFPMGTNGFSKTVLCFAAASTSLKFNVDQGITRIIALFLFTLADSLLVTILGLTMGTGQSPLGGTRLLDLLRDESCALQREPVELPKPPKELARRYEKLSLADVDIGYSGRQVMSAAVHRSIANAATGDALTLWRDGATWELRDVAGATVGRLAKRYTPPEGMHCIKATVAAVVVWRREWTDPEYADGVRCDQGEVLVPELVLEP
jgi:rod shape-determining protein MreD